MKDIKVIQVDDLKGTGWVELPPQYLPPVFRSGSKIYLRRTAISLEIRAECKAVSTATWSLATATLPSDWCPEFPVRTMLCGNRGQVGCLYIKPTGEIIYTGPSLTESYEPSTYIYVRTDKPYPKENPR